MTRSRSSSIGGTARCRRRRFSASMSVIAVRGLTKRFGSVVAVDDLHLDVRDGELMALLGPSGRGKTTTLRTIAGLESADAGEIHCGEPRGTRVPPERRHTSQACQRQA